MREYFDVNYNIFDWEWDEIEELLEDNITGWGVMTEDGRTAIMSSFAMEYYDRLGIEIDKEAFLETLTESAYFEEIEKEQMLDKLQEFVEGSIEELYESYRRTADTRLIDNLIREAEEYAEEE